MQEVTSREREVLALLVQGLPGKQIASKLHIERTTVRAHIRHLKLKLGVNGIGGLVRIALEEGLDFEEESGEPANQAASFRLVRG